MQVFDLTKLREFYNKPEPRVRELQHDAHYTEVTSVHNVVINEETAFAYLVGTKTCRGGLHTVDIREPTRPTYAGCFDEDGCKWYHKHPEPDPASLSRSSQPACPLSGPV